jgi:hypothetical protein
VGVGDIMGVKGAGRRCRGPAQESAGAGPDGAAKVEVVGLAGQFGLPGGVQLPGEGQLSGGPSGVLRKGSVMPGVGSDGVRLPSGVGRDPWPILGSTGWIGNPLKQLVATVGDARAG